MVAGRTLVPRPKLNRNSADHRNGAGRLREHGGPHPLQPRGRRFPPDAARLACLCRMRSRLYASTLATTFSRCQTAIRLRQKTGSDGPVARRSRAANAPPFPAVGRRLRRLATVPNPGFAFSSPPSSFEARPLRGRAPQDDPREWSAARALVRNAALMACYPLPRLRGGKGHAGTPCEGVPAPQ